MSTAVKVCGPKESPSEGVKLSVASRAPVDNPSRWKNLWKLSPFSIVPGLVPVPGMDGVYSKTVENAWQFLKVWEGETEWNAEEAKAAFDSDCAIRFPRGRSPKVRGHYWAENGQLLDYVSARIQIYLPLYLKMLELPDRKQLIDEIREASLAEPVTVWDFDSYSAEKQDLGSLFDTIFYTKRPFAHAFIVALAVNQQIPDFQDYIRKKCHG